MCLLFWFIFFSSEPSCPFVSRKVQIWSLPIICQCCSLEQKKQAHVFSADTMKSVSWHAESTPTVNWQCPWCLFRANNPGCSVTGYLRSSEFYLQVQKMVCCVLSWTFPLSVWNGSFVTCFEIHFPFSLHRKYSQLLHFTGCFQRQNQKCLVAKSSPSSIRKICYQVGWYVPICVQNQDEWFSSEITRPLGGSKENWDGDCCSIWAPCFLFQELDGQNRAVGFVFMAEWQSRERSSGACLLCFEGVVHLSGKQAYAGFAPKMTSSFGVDLKKLFIIFSSEPWTTQPHLWRGYWSERIELSRVAASSLKFLALNSELDLLLKFQKPFRQLFTI